MPRKSFLSSRTTTTSSTNSNHETEPAPRASLFGRSIRQSLLRGPRRVSANQATRTSVSSQAVAAAPTREERWSTALGTEPLKMSDLLGQQRQNHGKASRCRTVTFAEARHVVHDPIAHKDVDDDDDDDAVYYSRVALEAFQTDYAVLLQTLRDAHKQAPRTGRSGPTVSWVGGCKRVYAELCLPEPVVGIHTTVKELQQHQQLLLDQVVHGNLDDICATGTEMAVVPAIVHDTQQRRNQLHAVLRAAARTHQDTEAIRRVCQQLSRPSCVYARHVASFVVEAA